MARALRAAVVGTGSIGPVYVDALRSNGVEVVGLVGSGSEASRRTAGALRLPVFDALGALLARENVDCVHVATPNHLHATMVKQALEAGGSAVPDVCGWAPLTASRRGDRPKCAGRGLGDDDERGHDRNEHGP